MFLKKKNQVKNQIRIVGVDDFIWRNQRFILMFEGGSRILGTDSDILNGVPEELVLDFNIQFEFNSSQNGGSRKNFSITTSHGTVFRRFPYTGN